MIKNLLLIFCVFSFPKLFAQNAIYTIAYTFPQPVSFFEDRDSAGYFYMSPQAGNIWQIGAPSKTIFSSAYSPGIALVTDTLNPYPVNNESSFEFLIYSDDVTIVHFWHRYDTDSLSDGGVVEVSPDGGTTWNNIIDEPQIQQVYSFYADLSTISSNGNKPGFTGYSDWTYSGFAGYAFNFLRFRFTFTSDAVNTNKEGWMLDNFNFECLGTGIVEFGKSKPFLLYPNPTDGNFSIRSEAGKKVESVRVMDVCGKTILNSMETTVSLADVPPGLYTVEITTPDGKFFSPIMRGSK